MKISGWCLVIPVVATDVDPEAKIRALKEEMNKRWSYQCYSWLLFFFPVSVVKVGQVIYWIELLNW